MRRRVVLTIVVAILALMMALAGGPAALAASKRLPIRSGPHGLSRAPAAITPKIVGGKPVPNGKYPFQAALLAQSFGTNDFQRQYCGASLITPFEVLTAAHCVDFVGDDPGRIPLSDLRVVVGRTVLTSTQGQKRRVAAIDIHPRWDPVTFSFDAAVVHLASPINGIRPVALVTPGVDALERPGTLATVTGWGNTIQQPAGPGGGGINYPDRMREAQVPITSRAECRTAYAAPTPPSRHHAVRRADQPRHLPGRQRRPAVLQGRRPRLHPGRHHQLGHRLRRDRLPRGLHPPQQPGGGELHPLGHRGRPGLIASGACGSTRSASTCRSGVSRPRTGR